MPVISPSPYPSHQGRGIYYNRFPTACCRGSSMPREQKRMPSRVLIIEDDKDIAHLVALHLRDTGYEVSLAFDGKAGLEQALSKPYDLIILDLMLPAVDGLEVCRRMR